MRLLMLPRYDRLGASSRLRTYQYVPSLRKAGFDVEVSPLFDDTYLRSLYSGKKSPPSVVRGYARRIISMFEAAKYDVVWVEKELLPWMPPAVDRIFGRAKLVVDYDDAIFHRYDEHPSSFVRKTLGKRIDAVMSRADVVTAGNAYLAARAEAAGCARVERLPTVVDLLRYVPRNIGREVGPTVIGWIGSPATAHYLHEVSQVVAHLSTRYAIRALAVGARPDQVVGTPFQSVPWSEQSEAALVAGFDIGIMPLPDAPWERGKCGYKLIQYMACGVPVVASAVGANKDIVQPDINGELVMNEKGWEVSLSRLIENAGMRRRMGLEGRRQVEEWYSLQAQTPRLVNILQETARG